jgi:hypothetical protein
MSTTASTEDTAIRRAMVHSTPASKDRERLAARVREFPRAILRFSRWSLVATARARKPQFSRGGDTSVWVADRGNRTPDVPSPARQKAGRPPSGLPANR